MTRFQNIMRHDSVTVSRADGNCVCVTLFEEKAIHKDSFVHSSVSKRCLYKDGGDD